MDSINLEKIKKQYGYNKFLAISLRPYLLVRKFFVIYYKEILTTYLEVFSSFFLEENKEYIDS